MIRFDDVSITYDGATAPVLHRVDLHVPEGELALVVGRTGSGKSTLLRAVNGLVPHFTGGNLSGRVTVGGRDTRTHPPRELSDVVGVVLQDPLEGFVTDTVEDELAYGMESLRVPPAVMRRRVEETLDLLGLTELRDRSLLTLSGGQRQRVAIGSVLTTHPRVLVLDEPTSALDPPAAEEVLAALTRLVHDLGMTVLLAEHRLERVVQYADRIVHVPGDGGPVTSGPPAQMMALSPVVPPVVELGRLAGWDPLPLSVRDARRRAALPDQQESTVRSGPQRAPGPSTPVGGLRDRLGTAPPAPTPAPATGPPLLAVTGVDASYGRVPVLRGVDLTVGAGEVVALMGRNGAGKSTLLAAAVGLVKPGAGRVRTVDVDPAAVPPRRLAGLVGLVPQEPGDLLYAESVTAECRTADGDSDAPAGTTLALLDRLVPGIDPALHPRDLSEGQRLGLALAVVLATGPRLLLLDEPTRGLDYAAKERLRDVLRSLAADGHGLLLATHDVELVAEVADRVVVLADGEVVADGPTAEVVTASPAFAPQVAKILAPDPWLTTEQVRSRLEQVRA